MNVAEKKNQALEMKSDNFLQRAHFFTVLFESHDGARIPGQEVTKLETD